MKNTIQDISSLGGNPIYFAVAFLFLITKHFREFWILTIAFVIAYLITMAIRFTWWQERPDKQKYHGLWEKFDSGSFPSLHAARATMLAIFVSIFYQNIFVWIAFIAAVVLVCWARVYLKRHRLIDVIIGALTGLIIGVIAPQIINALGIF